MKKFWLLALVTVSLIAVQISLYSQSSGGGYTESYLLRDVGARPSSMAGAYTAIVNEPSALYYNPAGLGFFSDEAIIATSYSFLEYGRKHSMISWGQMVTENLGVGLGFNSFYSGSFVKRDVRGNHMGNMSSFAYSITAAAAYSLEFASFGGAIKYLEDRLYGDDASGSGYSFDLGMKFDVAGLLSFGLAVQDVSGMMFWKGGGTDEQDLLPYTVRTGVAMEFALNDETYTSRSGISGELETNYIPATQYVLVGLDVIIRQHERAPKYVLGVEASLHEIIAFRGGIALYGEKYGTPQLFPMNTWGTGISLRPRFDDLPFNMNLDYSLAADEISGNGIAHQLSIMFEL